MRIWVDADACPGAVRDVVLAASYKRKIETIFVANKQLTLPVSDLVQFILVGNAPDAADAYIIEQAVRGDLVITQDIPLAHPLVRREIVVISPRGVVFDDDNIGERLSIRDMMQDMRDAGMVTGGPKQFGEREKREFASSFDRELTKLLKKV
jgi:uncharacterized protein YaiI (UPF0178 family)